MLSQKAKYALRALLSLAEAPRGETVLISEIATKHRIPKKFLEQILLDLKNHGLVQSWRGRSGGYALLKAASEISFGQVLRIIDGPLAPLPCVSGLAYRKCTDCQDEANCALKRVFADEPSGDRGGPRPDDDRRCPQGGCRVRGRRRWRHRAAGLIRSFTPRSDQAGRRRMRPQFVAG